VPYLTITFSNILKDRIVSDELKSGILTPVIKKNKDPTDFYNYRGNVLLNASSLGTLKSS
jgi:hypothetical protein